MHTQVNRFKHLPHRTWKIENVGEFRGSSYWHNTAAQQVRYPRMNATVKLEYREDL